MPFVTKRQWERLEQWSAPLILAGGTVLLIDALVHGMNAFMGVPTPPAFRGVLWGVGFFGVYLGLLGFYPGLANQTPNLARAGAVAAAVASVGNAVIAVWWVGRSLLPTLPMPNESAAVNGVVITAMVLGFLLFGSASTRTDVPSRVVGLLLLLTPVVAVIALLVRGFILVDLPQYAGGFLSIGAASVVILAVGYLLHTGGDLTGRVEPTDPTA